MLLGLQAEPFWAMAGWDSSSTWIGSAGKGAMALKSDPATDVRPLAPAEFEQIRGLAYQAFGLDLKHGKEELVSARLRKLALAGGHRNFQEYYRSIVSDKTGAC